MKRLLSVHSIQLSAILALSVLASACSSLGLQTPKSFEEKIETAYTTLTAVRDSSTTLAQHGKISRKQFGKFIDQCDSARETIELARTVHATNAGEGQKIVTGLTMTLKALNAYLTKIASLPPVTQPPEVTRHENPRRPARFYNPGGFTDEGSAAIYVAAAESLRRADS